MKASLATLGAMLLLAGATPAAAQQTIHPEPGKQKSPNVKLLAHLPMGGPFYSNDGEFEQEPSRPYAYVSGRSHYGFKLISLKDLNAVHEIYRWTIENPELHTGRATAPGVE